MVDAAPHPATRRPTLALFAAAVAVAAPAYLVNLRGAVDFDLDEVMYAIAAQNVATHGSISWGDRPVAVHPPLHFLLTGLWVLLTGTARGPVLDALLAGRVMGALASIGTVVLVGLLCRRYCRDVRLVAVALGLAIVDGFLLRFGRTALIEPTAVLAGSAVVWLALRLRTARAPVYVGVLGVVSGLALLLKEPLLFTVAVPVFAAALERDRAYLRRSAAAFGVALLVWAVFPLWAWLSGAGGWWWAQHRTSLARLAGVLQVSGMNRAGVSEAGVFSSTFGTYLSGYLIFAAGAAGLCRLAWTSGALRGRPVTAPVASLIAYAVLSYGFLGYCVLFGQANEQLTAYSAVPAVLVTAVAWARPRARYAIALGAALVLVGAAAWVGTVALARDDATLQMGRYLTSHDPCLPVNATGDALRWLPVLPDNPVTGFADGPDALAAGVHLFLLSSKDSAMRYGTSSPELDAWVRGHAQPVRILTSRRYRSVELWSVPGPQRSAAQPCGTPRPPVAGHAGSTLFLALLLLVVVLIAAAGCARLRRGGP